MWAQAVLTAGGVRREETMRCKKRELWRKEDIECPLAATAELNLG
jgi:hypothetical protein